MLKQRTSFHLLLKRIDTLSREIEHLKRDLLQSLPPNRRKTSTKPSLFGSVSGGDVTDEMIGEARQSLFRTITDLK